MNHRFQKNKKGFSLVEVLISLLILSLGTTSVVFLMMKNIQSSQNSRDQIVASVLAQEGVELVRNLKDNKFLDGSPNYDFSSSSDCSPASDCWDLRVDKSLSFFDETTGTEQLHLDNNNFYVHSGGTAETNFFRRINLEVSGDLSSSPSDREIKATCLVTWNGKGFIDELAGVDSDNTACTVANKCLIVTSIIPDYIF